MTDKLAHHNPSRLGGRDVGAGYTRAQWQALGLISLAVVCSLTTWFSATAIIPELTSRWNLSPTQAAWLTNSVQAGFVVGAVVSSLLNISDIVPAKKLMVAAAIVAAIANFLLLLEPGLLSAVLLRFITGVALAGVYPPALKLVASWFRRGRGLALGAVIGALTLGSSMPHLLGALGETVHWYFVIAGTSLLTCIGALLFAVAAKEGPHGFAAASFDPHQCRLVLTNRPLMLANIGYFGHMWELYAMWGWYLAFVASAIDNGIPSLAGKASIITFVVVSSGIVGSLLGGWLADKVGRTTTTIVMMTVSAASAVAIGFVFDGPPWLLLAVSVVWGISVIGDSAQFSAAVTELADQRFVGTALTLQLGIGFALTVVSIWLIPLFASWMGGWRWAFLILAPGPAIGIVAMLLLRAHPEAPRMSGGRR